LDEIGALSDAEKAANLQNLDPKRRELDGRKCDFVVLSILVSLSQNKG
jgi:hypothetical protein